MSTVREVLEEHAVCKAVITELGIEDYVTDATAHGDEVWITLKAHTNKISISALGMLVVKALNMQDTVDNIAFRPALVGVLNKKVIFYDLLTATNENSIYLTVVNNLKSSGTNTIGLHWYLNQRR